MNSPLANALARFDRIIDRSGPDLFYSSREWLELRYRVLKKSAGCCLCCGNRGNPDNPLQVDHIKPRSKFPHLALSESNLQVLCRDCNLGKGAWDLSDWRGNMAHELTIVDGINAIDRLKLRRLGWTRLNGETALERITAQREYRRLWRQVERDWIEAA
jgi:hypothetical protein